MRGGMAVWLVAATLWWGSAARAAEVSAADRRAIEGAITGQIEAFRRDAAEAAFGFASPGIRALFGNPARFMDMVRQGYPPVYRPREFAFGEVAEEEGRVVQRVRIVGPDGAAADALYTMEREADGTWRIDGCALTRPSELRT